MTSSRHDVCSVRNAWALDAWFRNWLQNPDKIVGPYVREGMTALDFGCGPGYFSIAMAKMVGRTGRVIACDLQADMLQIVRRKIAATHLERRVQLHQCRENSIDLTTTVDFALAFYVVHEVPDPSHLFTELAALVKPNGTLLLIEPPFHVSTAEFESTVRKAEAAGFVHTGSPKVFFSRTALMKRSVA